MKKTKSQAWRVIDANANRTMEGLRTLEEYARFVREDPQVCQWLKDLRHELADALQKLDRRERLKSRLTESDVGTSIGTAQERSRESLSDVVPAASERVMQALRQLEEFGKFIESSLGERLEQLRYRAYDVLAKSELRLTGTRTERFSPVSLYLLVDCSRPIEQFASYLRNLARAGVDWVQLRDKSADAAELIRYGKAARVALTDTDTWLAINDRVDVALCCAADAVHLGQEDVTLGQARRLVGHCMAVGISTHNLQQAIEAQQGGADYIGCGPTFPSGTKAFDSFAGPDFLQEVHESIQLPYYAIGGIHAGNLEQVIATGCRRIAVSGAIHQADDPEGATRQLKASLASNVASPEGQL